MPRDRNSTFEPQIVPKGQTRFEGFDEKILSLYARGMRETVFPKAQVQLCIVHLVRASLAFVGYKQRKEVAADLQKIYRAATSEEAELRLAEFAAKWDARVPDDCANVAQKLGAGGAVLRAPAGNPPRDLHDQRNRVDKHEPAKDHQESRFVSD